MVHSPLLCVVGHAFAPPLKSAIDTQKNAHIEVDGCGIQVMLVFELHCVTICEHLRAHVYGT